jgi:hypothetical protein
VPTSTSKTPSRSPVCTRHWISFGDRKTGAVTVPLQGARSAVISQRWSGRLRSGTTPRAWYCPMTDARVTPAPRRHPSTTQCFLSIFSCSVFEGPSVQFLRNCSIEFPVNANSANSGLFFS